MRVDVVLADLAGGVPAPEVGSDGGVTAPVVVLDLDLDAGRRDEERARAALADRIAVTVGVTRRPLDESSRELASGLDLVLSELPDQPEQCVVSVPDLDSAVTSLVAAVDARPRAALVVTALLRSTTLLPLSDGLVAEASSYSTLLAGPDFAGWLDRRGPARPPLAEEPQRVAVEREGDLLKVRLVRVRRRNAFDAAMRVALCDALEVAVADPSLHVRVSGEGPVFSAGGDLDEFGSAADPATAWVVRVAQAPGRLLAQLGERVAVRVHGACAGAGVELPAFAARVVADPGTTFRLPELGLGLLPGAGGTVSLPRRIGRWRTTWLALSCSVLDATTALRWGLVDELNSS